MPANEVKVKINGPVAITLNDYSSGNPVYVLTNTAKLLSAPKTRYTKTDRQGEHGGSVSLPWDEMRELPFEVRIVRDSQSARTAAEDDLRACLARASLQSYSGNDGFILLEITLESGVLTQCYAMLIEGPDFDIVDNADPGLRDVGFVMLMKDPRLYSQTLQSASGVETYQGTNFSVVQGASPTVPFQLYQNTVVSVTCTNNGTRDTPPAITVTGPTTSPRVTNVTTGKYIELTGLTLLAGESVVIDVSKRTITKNDGTDLSAYWGSGSSWLVLNRGANQLTLLDGTPSLIQATLQVQWRDAY